MGEILTPYGSRGKIFMVQRTVDGNAVCRDRTFDLYDEAGAPLGHMDIAFTSLVRRALGRSQHLRFFPCFLVAMYDTNDQLLAEGNFSVVVPLLRMVLQNPEDEFIGRMYARHTQGDFSGYYELGLIGPAEESLGAIVGGENGRLFEMRADGDQVISSVTADIQEIPEALMQYIGGRFTELWEASFFHQHMEEMTQAAVVGMTLAGPFMLRRVNDDYT